MNDFLSESIYNYVDVKPRKSKGFFGKLFGKTTFDYVVTESVTYYSKRYNKFITAKVGDVFDGATGAMDIDSFAWVFHDVLCRDGYFDGAWECTNLQASQVVSDILKEQGHNVRAKTWFAATWLFGGGKARKNGMF